MSAETFILLAIAYVVMMVLVFCLLVGAKRSDEAVAGYYDGIASDRAQG